MGVICNGMDLLVLFWIMTAMADVIAVGVYVKYWFNIPRVDSPLICIIILLGLNLLTVKLFGELEF